MKIYNVLMSLLMVPIMLIGIDLAGFLASSDVVAITSNPMNA